MKVAISYLQLVYSSKWFTCIYRVNSKLRSYCKFKTTFQQEIYVVSFNRVTRSTLTKLRVSTVHITLELKRLHIYPKSTIRGENLWSLWYVCFWRWIYFLMRCKLYDKHRQKNSSLISRICFVFILFLFLLLLYFILFYDVDNLPPHQLVVKLMSAQVYDILLNL